MNGGATVRLFIFHSFLSRLYFFIPILVLWFLAQGFTQFQVTILLSVFFLSTTLAEVPTGIFSDRFGHTRAMALCNLFQAVGVTLLAFASNVNLAIIGELLMGIGQAFYTGSKEAFLFDFLKQQRISHLYQKHYAHSKFYEFVAMGAASLVGGTLYIYWGQLPFFLSAAAFLASSGVALFLKERRNKKRVYEKGWGQLLKGFQEIRTGSTNLKVLIFYYCLIFTSILIFIVTLVQPYLKEAGVPLAWFGVVFLFFQCSSMGGSQMAKRLPDRFLSRRFFTLLAFGFFLVLGGLSWLHHPLSFLLVSLVYLIWGLFLPTTSHAVNRLIGSEHRATILSTQDFIQHLLFVIVAPLLGLATDAWGLPCALWMLSALIALAVLLSRKLRMKRGST